ncbi:MAG TPA: VWA domain-containing protein [Vicinamibacteria bacterium]|jgi:VWFA-related protein
MSRQRIVGKLVAVVLLAVVAVAAGVNAEDPLTTADLIRFLRAGLSERTILTELKDRGFGEALDATREAALRQAGATETLIVAVRRVAPGAPPPAPVASATPRPRAEGAATPPVEGPHGLTFGATTKSVRVPVSVLDKRGEPVLGLSGQDFQVSENGQKQAVTYFSGERRPLRIALCLDVSTSMTEKMKEVSEALRHFINVLEPADEIMVITFSADVHVDQDFTSDRERLERVFSKLQPDQGTALYDAVIEALRRVAPGPAESKAVVVVTDGVDTASRAGFGELREIARRTEVPIFSLGIGADYGLLNIFRPRGGLGGMGGGRGPRGPVGGWPGGGGRWPGGGGGRGGWPGGGGRGPSPVGGPDQDLDAGPLRELAEETGGRCEVLKGLDHDHGKNDRLKEAVESIAVTLRHRYLVGYEPQTQPGKAGWRKIKVEVDRPSVTVQARKGYYTEG